MIVRVVLLVLVGLLLAAGPAAASGLGPNVIVFDPGMPTAQIHAVVDPITAQQRSDQFGTGRYALLFKPGTYGIAGRPAALQVGYYTEVAGLGASPEDVVINGTIDVLQPVLRPRRLHGAGQLLALDVQPDDQRRRQGRLPDGRVLGGVAGRADAARAGQRRPMTLMDYCSAPVVRLRRLHRRLAVHRPTVINGSQQQFLVRNSSLDGWSNGVWNQVFAGVAGAPAQTFPERPGPYTTLATTPRSREKPFLLRRREAALQRLSSPPCSATPPGTTWADGRTPGDRSRSATSSSPSPATASRDQPRAAARQEPAVHARASTTSTAPIRVKRPRTVVLGLGMATLTAQRGASPMRSPTCRASTISGLLFDAGPVNSPVLLQVGAARHGERTRATRPPLHDVFFRIGGAARRQGHGRASRSTPTTRSSTTSGPGAPTTARASAGRSTPPTPAWSSTATTSSPPACSSSTTRSYEVIWNGERGEDDLLPERDALRPAEPGRVAARRHARLGRLQGAPTRCADPRGLGPRAATASSTWTRRSTPATRSRCRCAPGVRLHDILTLSINDHGTIDHVVNDYGPPTSSNTTTSNVTEYPPG